MFFYKQVKHNGALMATKKIHLQTCCYLEDLLVARRCHCFTVVMLQQILTMLFRLFLSFTVRL